MSARAVSMKDLILIPSLITLGVTVLRLVGELQNWSPALFNKSAGGGGALVGISWLIVVFAFYFGWRLTREGDGAASPGKVAGLAFLAMLAVSLATFAATGLGQGPTFGVFILGSIVSIVLTARLWPALWKALLIYAFAARIPVAVVMLFAILGNWGTHYDVPPPQPPPGFDALTPVMKWVMIGLVPQMTIWIFTTVVGGMVVGGLAGWLARKR